MSEEAVVERPPEVADEVVDAAPKSTAVALFSGLNRIAAGLDALRKEHDAADWDVETTAGEEAARRFRKRCVGIRASADAAYEMANQPILKQQKDARTLRDSIKQTVAEIEKPWDVAITAKEQRKAAEKAAREEAERKRIAAIRERIATIQGMALSVATAGSVAIADKMAELEAVTITEELFGDFAPEAEGAAMRAASELAKLHAAAVEREELAARLEREQAELKRQQEELARKREAEAAAARIKSDRLAAITGAVVRAVGKPSAEVARIIAELEALAPTEAEDGDIRGAHAEALRNLETFRVAAAGAEEALAARARREAEELAERNRQWQALEESRRQQKAQQDAFEEERAAARKKLEDDQRALAEQIAAATPTPPAAEPEPEPDPSTMPAGGVDALDVLAAAGEPAAQEVAAAIEQSAAEEPAAQPQRPTDLQILQLIAGAFNVTTEVALWWVAALDVAAEAARIGGRA